MAPAKAAIDQTANSVTDMTGRMAVGASGAKELGEVTTLAGTQARESIYEARGEAALLGEMFGIHLPRHVRSFIAELPGVGVALSAAFQATAILFVIEAIVQGVEKLSEWAQEAHKIALAQEEFQTAVITSFNSLDDKLLRSGAKLDELRGDHLGALRKELELIDHQSMNELIQEFDKLAKAADAVFKELETHWFSLDAGSKGAENALKDFQSKFQLLVAEGKDKEANDLLAGTLKSAQDSLETMKKMAEEAKELKTIITPDERAIQVERGGGPGPKEIQAQQDLVDVLQAEVTARQKINQETDNQKTIKSTEEANRAEADAERIFKAQIEAQKRADEEEDKLEDDRRNHYIQSMQEQEKERIAATKAGSEERIRIIDAAIKEEEAHGFQDTAYYKSLQVQRIQAVQARADQEIAAQRKSDEQQFKLDEQQAKREVDTLKQSSSEQQKAITDLANAKVITQTEASKRLVASYEDEKSKALAILQSLLDEEKALMEKTAQQLSAAKLNPAVSPEQVQQVETLLGQIKNAVANTEAQIQKVKSDTNTKILALDQSYYGESVKLAVAAGNQELAAQLRLAKAELETAKARGQNTKAIQAEIAALEKNAHQLTVAGNSLQRLLTLLRQGGGLEKIFQQDMNSMSRGMQSFGTTADFVFSEFGSAMEGAVQSAIMGEKSLGEAMAAATAQVIAQIAARAMVWGLFYTAQGIADVFWNPARAGADFAAAAEFLAIGAGAAAAAHAINPGKGGSASSGGGGIAAPGSGSAIATSGGASGSVNVPHLASGALISRPSLAVVGDAGPEAVLPLRGPAMRDLAGAIAAHVGSMGGGQITITLKTDTHQFVKELNHNVKTGRVRLEATNSRRVTRQS